MIMLSWKCPNKFSHVMRIPLIYEGEPRYGFRRLAEVLNEMVDEGIRMDKVKVRFL